MAGTEVRIVSARRSPLRNSKSQSLDQTQGGSGWSTVVAALPAALAFDVRFGLVLLDHAERLVVTAGEREQRRLRAARNCLEMPWLEARETLTELGARRSGHGAAPDDGCAGERAAILAWRQAQDASVRPEVALRELGEAATRLPATSERLRSTVVDALRSLGISLYNRRRYADALAAFERCAAIDPGDISAQDWLIVTIAGLGRHDEAMAVCDRALATHPGSAKLHKARGLILTDRHEYERALAALDRAVELDPQYAASHAGRGFVLMMLDRLPEALLELDRAIELDRMRALSHTNRAWVLCDLGREQDAMAAFDWALEIDSDRSGAHAGRGRLLLARGDIDQAEESLLRAVELLPDGAMYAWAVAGAVAWHRGRMDEARRRFTMALRCGPTWASHRTPFGEAQLRAIALCGTGRGPEARSPARGPSGAHQLRSTARHRLQPATSVPAAAPVYPADQRVGGAHLLYLITDCTRLLFADVDLFSCCREDGCSDRS
jgi:tetratricopeptide (TPR) repeat protein